jgi:hypothetical protein
MIVQRPSKDWQERTGPECRVSAAAAAMVGETQGLLLLTVDVTATREINWDTQRSPL